MSATSKIEWTDATWNPITGCTQISEGCQNCYAKAMAERFPVTHAGRDIMYDGYSGGNEDCGAIPFSRITFHPDRLDQPLRWRKPRKIFVCSMGDLFHDDVKDEWIESVMKTIHHCPQHTFMILTKRPENMKRYFAKSIYEEMTNVWLGVTCENQRTANERIPILLDTPAAKRFVSVEPMLKEVDLYRGGFTFLEPKTSPQGRKYNALDWVICGAETGAHKRPCKTEWINGLRQQCDSAGVPFFGKKDSNGQAIMPREWPEETSWPKTDALKK